MRIYTTITNGDESERIEVHDADYDTAIIKLLALVPEGWLMQSLRVDRDSTVGGQS
ncbi:hypothetical protein AB4Y63_17685 [Leifsonia sp. YAF41]|uniref:hypothetical protein n=1 Tax=Leifsonia sp. YAF41 TaxID=3233086 RepID=UPI003F9EAD26